MKRGLLIAGAVIVVLAAVGGYLLYSSLDSLIRAAVEKYGSEITKAEVRLRKVELSPTSGRAALYGFRVGNPEPFKADHAIRLDEISVTLDVASVTGDVIRIREIVIGEPDIIYELGREGSNFGAIQRNVDAYLGTEAEKKRTPKEPAQDGEKGPRLIIENLYLRGARAEVIASALEGKNLTVSLPDIHLKDLGKGKGGVTPGEMANEVLAALRANLQKAVSAAGSKVGESLLKEGASKAAETLRKEMESLGKSTEGAGGALKKLLGD